jgi:hypothetical protein
LARWSFESTRAIDAQEWLESRIMNLFGNDWPELSELSEHLAWLPTVTTVNGKGLDIDFRVIEATALAIIKVVIIHPDPARNQIRCEKGPVAFWKRWVPDAPLLCLDPNGVILNTPEDDRFLAHCTMRFFRQAVNLREQDYGVSQRFRLLKHGIPLDIPQANFPQRLLVSIEASDLKTDLTGRSPIRDPAYQERVEQIQAMLITACQMAEEAISSQKFWLSLSQNSCLENLAQIRQSLARNLKL